jgi:hypothetical protein
MNAEQQRAVDKAGGYHLLWMGVLGGPISWLTQFQLRYALVPWVCSSQNLFALHITSLVFLLLTIAGGLVCWRDWRRRGAKWPCELESGPAQRDLFLSLLGMFSTGLFSLLIIAQAIPAFLLDPCQS